MLRIFQDKLASNASRFQSKKYTPDSRILTYLKVRAHDFNVPVPAFVKKRAIEKGNGSQQIKRGRSQGQQSRSRSHNAYLQQSTSGTAGSSNSMNNQLPATLSQSKGPRKGKGKDAIKGKRQEYHSVFAPSNGKGFSRGKGAVSHKGKGPPKGKSFKGKGQRFNSGTSLSTLVCGFCHLHGHHEANCRKKHALQNSDSYQQARSQFNSRQQLLIDQLENSLFAPNVCSWCLQCNCNDTSCYPPEEPSFYSSTTHLFQEALLPFVQNAKLGLPIDNSAPLMPEHYAFEDADWGQDYNESDFENWHSVEVQPSQESSWAASSSSNFDQYIMEDEPDGQEMEYEVEQLETQVNEMEGTEDGNCDSLLMDSNTAEDQDAPYDEKYDEEIQ